MAALGIRILISNICTSWQRNLRRTLSQDEPTLQPDSSRWTVPLRTSRSRRSFPPSKKCFQLRQPVLGDLAWFCLNSVYIKIKSILVAMQWFRLSISILPVCYGVSGIFVFFLHTTQSYRKYGKMSSLINLSYQPDKKLEHSSSFHCVHNCVPVLNNRRNLILRVAAHSPPSPVL